MRSLGTRVINTNTSTIQHDTITLLKGTLSIRLGFKVDETKATTHLRACIMDKLDFLDGTKWGEKGLDVMLSGISTETKDTKDVGGGAGGLSHRAGVFMTRG